MTIHLRFNELFLILIICELIKVLQPGYYTIEDGRLRPKRVWCCNQTSV
jgi:hypothetical protein